MKIASYHRDRSDVVRFVKGEDRSALLEAWDRVYVTTLFSFEWRRTAQAIDFAIKAAGNQTERVFVGGIAASLMHDEFLKVERWAGVRFIAGLLDGPPATALLLSAEEGDFGAEDLLSDPIDRRVPDYDILSNIDYQYPVFDAYFGYATRGCVRKCKFCGVPKLEGDQKEMPPLASLVNGVSERFGEKKDLVLMDNNVTASSRYKEIIAEIRDLGFGRGARLERDGRLLKRRVDFNQGVDARILVKSPMYLREMSTICIDPLRIAFDHIGVRKMYMKAVRMAADNDIRSLSNYMLYNFMDSPGDLFARMKLNIDLNEELGIRIWSFPMRYQPVTMKTRTHVGRSWNSYYLRTFQIMLQATHGIVSGTPAFFNRAFGEDAANFIRLLSYPHAFIFHRDHYEREEGGKEVRLEYENLRERMSAGQESELLHHLSVPSGDGERRRYYLSVACMSKVDPLVRRTIAFHLLDSKQKKIVNAQHILDIFSIAKEQIPTDDSRIIEDAGLYEDDTDSFLELDGTRLVARSGSPGR